MLGRENINQLWASLIVEECLRHGADTFFLAPGARCAPLTLAVARHPDARAVLHFDERGLGFAALGYARATGRPGVVITTSGSAVSNLMPAVVEARMDAQPMLLLTADRPPELRDTGANQAIRQAGHFAGQTVWDVDLPCPCASIPAAFVLGTLDHAMSRARSGPVQVNCMFREPLAPSPDGLDADAYLAPIPGWLASRAPHGAVHCAARRVDELIDCEADELLPPGGRVLVIAGGGLNEAEALAVRQYAQARGWPLVTDLCSGLHFGPHSQGTVRHVDALLDARGFPSALRPDAVIQFGPRFLSKRLLEALAKNPPRTWIQVTPREGRFDPAHRVTQRFVADIAHFCRAGGMAVSSGWLRTWLEADQRAAELFHHSLDEGQTLSEPAVARAVTRLLPNLHGLVAAASMPVRDLNQFAAPNPHVIHVAANRGASGIDGTLATAAGFARGLGQGVTVLAGDLATLHDLNSLALVARCNEPIVVVVVNNHGGGIFHFLPQAGMGEKIFEDFFATPHEWDFQHAARQFGLAYARPASLPDFAAAYREALSRRGHTLIEVVTDRRTNVEQHRALAEALKLETP
jgi:2-succinyl-5-enolpyruvyl-6-hydroxy-3-cyclohexene-1-carboxylate synthase